MGEISCPYCNEPLKYSADIARCSICRTGHHLVCWQQNNHCSVASCEGRPVVVKFARKEKVPHLKILLPVIIALILFLIFWLIR